MEGAEQRRKAEDAKSQLEQLAKENEELQCREFETEETASTEVEATHMRLELEGLRQLEEVQRLFDKERDRYQRKHKWWSKCSGKGYYSLHGAPGRVPWF